MNMHDNILDNLDQYTAKQLVRYIRQGIITLDELCEEKGLNREVIETVLGSAGFEYNKEQNKFW